jgi:hypothetical protein
LETSAKDLIPYGTLSLVLDRPEAFLTSLYQFFSGKPFAWTHTIPTEENIPAVLAFLSDISDNPHVDNTLTTTPLITFTLSREQRGDLMVGKYNYREALTLFNDVIAAHHKK